jgi:hypothetical protein
MGFTVLPFYHEIEEFLVKLCHHPILSGIEVNSDRQKTLGLSYNIAITCVFWHV